MTMEELDLALKQLNVPARAYSLGVDQNEKHCIVRDGDWWHVYYSERGHRNSEKTFSDESNACDALLLLLLGDRIVRSEMDQKH
jgi:hypothetical protein